MDSTGRSRGLAIGFNPASILAQASWGGQGFMGLDLFSADLGTSLRVINIYGPCQQRENFWNHLLSLSIFTADNIIIGGDLNFSLGYSESWGSMAQVDTINRYMTDLLERHNLIEVPMHKPLPTWRNRRIGEAALARRLDRRQNPPGGSRKPEAKILRDREESIRLCSRAIWLKAGDDNTRFFHNYAKGRKVKNTIWNIPLPEGGVADSFNKLSHLGSSHFRHLYKQHPGSSIADIINIVGHFPKFLNEDESEALFDPVTPRELESTLKWFKREKSPGLDGWTIEFYITFYDLLSNDLLRVVEECKVSGSLYNAVNSTFIALIPKSDSPSSFDDYRPISLCNVLYKIISKIIANRLRPILSRNIAPQQFAFLKHRQIHEAIGSAQEALHTI
eukprot:PITA_31123